MKASLRLGVIGLAIGFGAAARMGMEAAQQLRFTEPSPIDFNDHEGYVPLFDGVSLKGWDGNPKFWRVENGAIVGESTPANPSGNSYIVYRGLEAKDFTLKFEIKAEAAFSTEARPDCRGSRASRPMSPPTWGRST
jgi:hypothetical protein